MSYTGGEIVDRVFHALEEDTTFHTRAEALVHLNDALLELSLLTGRMCQDRAFALTTANFYATPSGAIAIQRVAYATKPLRKTSLEGLDREHPSWQRDSGVVKKWAAVGINNFVIHPHFAASGESLTLTTLDQHATVGEDTTIGLEDEYVDALVDYVHHCMIFKEGGAEFQQSLARYDAFLTKAGVAEADMMAKQFTLWSREPDAETGK